MTGNADWQGFRHFIQYKLLPVRDPHKFDT